MISAKKILVCCPGNVVTGGPELLHQLVYALRTLGHEAYIVYYPFMESFKCPVEYRKYNAPISNMHDDESSFLIVPETATWILKKIKRAGSAIWWLSVDNYFPKYGDYKIKDIILSYKALLSQRIPMYRLKKHVHFSQSHYANLFLESRGIQGEILGDYLGSEHLVSSDCLRPRRDIIVYNPNKGSRRSEKIKNLNRDLEFVAIKGMTAKQTSDLLKSAKIYMDFGHHPGKDRLPREAAIAGCCVITGRQGSARFYEDLPIPEQYKLEDRTDEYLQKFRPLVNSIFSDYIAHVERFSGYRSMIMEEPSLFLKQVENIFGVSKERSVSNAK